MTTSDPSQPRPLPLPLPLLMSISNFGTLVGLGRRALYRLIAAGLPVVSLPGCRRMILVKEATAWISRGGKEAEKPIDNSNLAAKHKLSRKRS